MKSILLAIVVTLAFVLNAGGTLAQAQSAGVNIKTVSEPDPVFPAEAKNHIYGDTVRVEVDVNKSGKVTSARPQGPLAPCSNLKDPVAEAIRKAAVEAARSTVFEPVLKDGKPANVSLMMTYRLRPKVVPLPEEDRMTIMGGVLNGKAKYLPKPEYTPQAKAHRVGGSVQLQLLIGEDGRVISIGVLSGHPSLVPGTLDSACGAQFNPTFLAGKPARVLGSLVYNFVP